MTRFTAVRRSAASSDAPQRVVKVRRDYNSWVASETMEDYALRFTPQRFRKWSEWRVANTAFGAASFLILEAVGATLLVQYGFINAFWAIVATGVIIFLAGLPISVYAARYGVDMDLLTRGAGFGYIGSTLTSLIYASFTFIFFALEAAVMAYALELALGIPPSWGYLICALVVIPLVTHGVSAISRLQVWTQPLWLLMLVVPFVYVFMRDPGAFSGVTHYGGEKGNGSAFNLHYFGAALTVGIALITQMGEQADYLRFMPVQTAANRRRWWFGVLAGGPGWVILGVVKMLGGALLAYLAITHMVPVDRAVDPNQMYLAAYEYVFPNYGWAVAATALFVVVSQLKINVTNAYAGSLAWSQFFLAPHAQPPGAGGVGGVQHADRLHADGDERVRRAGQRARACTRTSPSRGSWPWWPIWWSTSRWGCRPKASSSSAPTCMTSTRWAWAPWHWPRPCRSPRTWACSARGRRRFRP